MNNQVCAYRQTGAMKRWHVPRVLGADASQASFMAAHLSQSAEDLLSDRCVHMRHSGSTARISQALVLIYRLSFPTQRNTFVR